MRRRPPTHLHRHTGKPIWESGRITPRLRWWLRHKDGPYDLTQIALCTCRDGSSVQIAACDLDNESIFIKLEGSKQ